MKKLIPLLLALLLAAGCAPAALSEAEAGMPNPLQEVTAQELTERTGLCFAVPEGAEPETEAFPELARLADSLGLRLAFLPAPRDDFGLWLRLGLCEICLAQDGRPDGQGEACLKLLAGGWQVLAREEDILWFRRLGDALS